MVDEELRSVDLVLGPSKLRRSDALAYIANYAAIRRMAMVVTLNGETWRNQKENFGFYLREVELTSAEGFRTVENVETPMFYSIIRCS